MTRTTTPPNGPQRTATWDVGVGLNYTSHALTTATLATFTIGCWTIPQDGRAIAALMLFIPILVFMASGAYLARRASDWTA